ncbi:hypothetical protein ACFL09_01720 [Planctomycetota bacterium]
MVTDFGIGTTGAVLKPKDDLLQVGLLATRMLQSILREELDHVDRLVYDRLCTGGVLKKLREASPLERGAEMALVEEAIAEVDCVMRRAFPGEVGTGVRTRFGDYLASEQLGERWEEWKGLFVPCFPGYDDVVSRNITVLTGTRGCGKTMVFRRLSALLNLHIGPVDREAATAFVGFYLNMNDIGDAFLFRRRAGLSDAFAKRVIQYFHLCLLAEVARVAEVARLKAAPEEQLAYDRANRWLFDFAADQVGFDRPYPGPAGASISAVTEIGKAKDQVRVARRPPARLAALGESDWLTRFVPLLQQTMPWIGDRPIYFFLDDYSLPRLDERLQTVLNSVIFRRSDSYFSKISTEAASTLHRTDYSGKELQDPDDFELTDLGSVTIDLSDAERGHFLDEVFQRRFARDERLQDCDLQKVLDEFDRSWTQLARDIRAASPSGGHDDGGAGSRSRRVLYHGKKVFVHMWSGDTRAMVRVALDLLAQISPGKDPVLPIDKAAQDKVLRRTGGQFLHLLQACTRTRRQGAPALPAHISSWGRHLVSVAEAFKEMALHELRTRTGGRRGRDEPKQAFRIEIVDQLSLGACPRIGA